MVGNESLEELVAGLLSFCCVWCIVDFLYRLGAVSCEYIHISLLAHVVLVLQYLSCLQISNLTQHTAHRHSQGGVWLRTLKP